MSRRRARPIRRGRPNGDIHDRSGTSQAKSSRSRRSRTTRRLKTWILLGQDAYEERASISRSIPAGTHVSKERQTIFPAIAQFSFLGTDDRQRHSAKLASAQSAGGRRGSEAPPDRGRLPRQRRSLESDGASFSPMPTGSATGSAISPARRHRQRGSEAADICRRSGCTSWGAWPARRSSRRPQLSRMRRTDERRSGDRTHPREHRRDHNA